MVSHTDKLTDVVILILWVRSAHNTSRVVQKRWRLKGFRYMPLNKLAVWVRTEIDIPLSPRVNSLRSTSEDRCTIENANRNRNVDELSVVDYKGTSERSVARFWSSNKDGGVLNNSINDGLGTSSLFEISRWVSKRTQHIYLPGSPKSSHQSQYQSRPKVGDQPEANRRIYNTNIPSNCWTWHVDMSSLVIPQYAESKRSQ